MVHTFAALGRYFMLDVESGSFYQIDGLTKNLIDNKNSPYLKKGEFLGYSKEEIAAAEGEIDDLVKEGALFSLEPFISQPPFNGIIKSICLNISHKCNLRCGYCFADGGAYASETAKNMPLETALKAVDFLIENSGKRRNLEIDFFGGEPLMNFDVVKKTVQYARNKEKHYDKIFKFTLTTNAVLLTDEIIDFLNQEMNNVVLSIDGRESVHDNMRKTASGNGSFDLALKNSLKFKELRGDKQYYVRGTFTRQNLDFAADALALADYGFDMVSLEPVVLPKGHQLAFKDSDIEALKAEYEKLSAEYIKRRKNPAQWFSFFHFNIDVENGPCETKRIKSCGAGCEYAAVSVDGKIYPCHRFDGDGEFYIGNVFEGIKNTEIQTLFNKNSVINKPKCLSCWAKYHCSGGCAANSVKYNASFSSPPEIECELMKKRLECALAIYAIENE